MFEDLKKGDTVIVPITFSDLVGSKKRPMLVLYHDQDKQELTLAYITSNISPKPGPYEIVVPLGSPSSIRARLREDSMILARWITVVKRILVVRKLGEADDDLRSRVNKAVADCLAI